MTKENFDELFNVLKERGYVSLYYNRIMFYNEGFSEIQFWTLDWDSDYLMLENRGITIFFNKWEIDESKSLITYINDTITGVFKFPSEKKIMQNHNHFYVDEFSAEMSDALDKNTNEKGDWTFCARETVLDGMKRNLKSIENSTDSDIFKKSCVDLANFSVMGYYLIDRWNNA